jgi:hypothetical protein
VALRLARKRPRLRPIWDSVVAAVTDTVAAATLR